MAFRIKPGAKPSFRLEMIKLRKAVEKVFTRHGMTTWLTSGTDGEHSVGSFHSSGYAEDYDGDRAVSDSEWQEIEDEARKELDDSRYQLIAHAGHLHGEYDPPEFKRYK